MRCFHNPEEHAVRVCQRCGRGLWFDCVVQFALISSENLMTRRCARSVER